MKKPTMSTLFSLPAARRRCLLGGLTLLTAAAFSPARVQADPPPNTGTWSQTMDDEFTDTVGQTDDNYWRGEKYWISGWSYADGSGYFSGTHTFENPNVPDRSAGPDIANYASSSLLVNNGLTILSSRQDQNDDEGYLHHYASGALSTDGKFSQKYGYFEAKIQVASTQGLDSAFWMLPANHYNDYLETDIVEVPSGYNWGTSNGDGTYTPGTIALLSGGQDSNFQGGTHAHATLSSGAPFGGDYHVYGIDWEPNSITWYIDNQPRKYIYNSGPPLAGVQSDPGTIPAENMYLLLNNEMQRDTEYGRSDGDWVGNPDNGSYDPPQQMKVAWVHAYQRTAPPPAAPAGIPDGTYYIMSRGSSQVIDVPAFSKDEPIRLDEYALNYGTNQQWQVTHVPAGDNSGAVVYRIANVNSTYDLDAAGGGTQNGTAVNQYQDYGFTNQQWQLTSTDSGYYTLYNYHSLINPSSPDSNLCLDVDGGSGLLQLWQNLNGPNQQWKFVPVQ